MMTLSFPSSLGKLEGWESVTKWSKPPTSIQKAGGRVNKQHILSGKHQTSVVEAFHSLTSLHRSLGSDHSKQWKVDLIWAAMHCNEHAARRQIKIKHGTTQHRIRFSKHKRGGFTIQKWSSELTYTYIDELVSYVSLLLPIKRKMKMLLSYKRNHPYWARQDRSCQSSY